MDEAEGSGAAGSEGRVARTIGFVTAARREMDKVVWPSQPELIRATRVVIVGAVVLGLALGFLDFLLGKTFLGIAAIFTS